MRVHVLLNLINELGKEIKCDACRAFYLFFATSLINSIIQESISKCLHKSPCACRIHKNDLIL